jgi:hypothetical protein
MASMDFVAKMDMEGTVSHLSSEVLKALSNAWKNALRFS